jgi:hypothetical protein
VYLDATAGFLANGVAWQNDAPNGSALAVVNGGNFAETNTALRQNGVGAAIRVDSGAAPAVTYSDFSGNAADFAGMPNLVGIDGNIAALPLFKRPAFGNFALKSTAADRRRRSGDRRRTAAARTSESSGTGASDRVHRGVIAFRHRCGTSGVAWTCRHGYDCNYHDYSCKHFLDAGRSTVLPWTPWLQVCSRRATPRSGPSRLRRSGLRSPG